MLSSVNSTRSAPSPLLRQEGAAAKQRLVGGRALTDIVHEHHHVIETAYHQKTSVFRPERSRQFAVGGTSLSRSYSPRSPFSSDNAGSHANNFSDHWK